MFNTTEILEGARELLLPRGAWITEDFFAVRAGNEFVDYSPKAEHANCYCLIGAVNKAAHDLNPSLSVNDSYDMSLIPEVREAAICLAEAAGLHSLNDDGQYGSCKGQYGSCEGRVIDWNDSRTRKSQVIKALDKAIEISKERDAANV